MVALGTPLKNALGDKTATALEKGLGLNTVGDLLRHYPRRYARHGELTDLAHLPLDEEVTVLAEVAKVMGRPYKNKKGSILEVTVTDGRGTLKLTFFNQAWRQKQLQVGRQGFFAGKVTVFNGVRQLTHPDYELIDARPTMDVNAFTDELIPVYPATEMMQSWKIAQRGEDRAGHPRPADRDVAGRAARAALAARHRRGHPAHPPTAFA